MPKAGKDYSSKNFRSLTFAYSQYQKDRHTETRTGSPVIAPRKRFASIWGWTPPRPIGPARRLARPE